MTPKKFKHCLASLLFCGVATPVWAQVIDASDFRPTEGYTWYYEIGGGDPYFFPYERRYHARLALSGGWSLFSRCEFDPSAEIRENFRQFGDQIQDFFASINWAQMVTAYGLSYIQQVSPGAYDLLTKFRFEFMQEFQARVKTCEQMMNDIENERNPLEGWVSFGKRNHYLESSYTLSDIESGREDISIWGSRGRTCGGPTPQPACEAMGEIVDSGYHYLTSGGGATGTPLALTRVFPSANSAKDWAKSVLGDTYVYVARNRVNNTQTDIGMGLRGVTLDERREVGQELATILGSLNALTLEDLDAVSAPGMGVMVTEGLLRAIIEEPPAEQAILMGRLTTDLALARSLEKAMITIDILKTGIQDPALANNEQYRLSAEQSIKRLREEVEDVLYERRIRSEVFSETAALLMRRHEGRTQSGEALKALDQPTQPPVPLHRGGITR